MIRQKPKHRTYVISLWFCLCLNSCQVPSTVPVIETDGSNVKRPDRSARVVVWGNQSQAVRSLTTWLLKEGYIVVDELKLNQLARDNHSTLPLSNVEVLNLAKTVKAKEVIFIDAEVRTWRSPEVLDFGGEAYKLSLLIRALNVETGEIDWNGNAVSMNKFRDLNKGIHQLTCDALATSWGLRKPGITADPNICPPGQNVMVANEARSATEQVVKSSASTDLRVPANEGQSDVPR